MVHRDYERTNPLSGMAFLTVQRCLTAVSESGDRPDGGKRSVNPCFLSPAAAPPRGLFPSFLSGLTEIVFP